MAKLRPLPPPKEQICTRVELRTYQRLRAYVNWITDPTKPHPPEADDWPDTISWIVDEALELWLIDHPTIAKGHIDSEMVKREKMDALAAAAVSRGARVRAKSKEKPDVRTDLQ